MPTTHYAFRALGLFDQCHLVLSEGQFLAQRTTDNEGVKLYHMPGGFFAEVYFNVQGRVARVNAFTSTDYLHQHYTTDVQLPPLE